MRIGVFIAVLVCVLPAIAADPKPDPAAVEFFEKQVRPVLAEHCYSCHGPKKQSLGLAWTRRRAYLRGAKTGR